MRDLSRNALSAASSPYLLQHQDDPVHWQEWNQETLAEAKAHKKMIFVSIGYATCHWCHVMARESFSDKDTADYLNAHFVPIKVDREQRPDIDRYFLEYVRAQQGSAGWPMSVVLAPDARPVFGGTYFPLHAEDGRPSFRDVLEQAVAWQAAHPEGVADGGFRMAHEDDPALPGEAKALLPAFIRAFDSAHGGFGQRDAKFPPHSPLLFLSAMHARESDTETEVMIRGTLDAMALRGLHDHLQGGFYRYCVDPAWTVPHFEKMLYDQAMHLMTYSVAWSLWRDPLYERAAGGVLRCLEDTFREGDLYVSAHDADTDHEEGATYVWTMEELARALTPAEIRAFAAAYDVKPDGNFEGKNHLVRRTKGALPEIEAKLLALRRKRAQPGTDEKIVTSVNALMGIAFHLHFRATGEAASREKVLRLTEKLLALHVRDDEVCHSSLHGKVQDQGFLEDYAAVLLLLTYAYEETRDAAYTQRIRTLRAAMDSFRDGDRWLENAADGDFLRVPAGTFDQPMPSSVALAECALLRSAQLLSEDAPDLPLRPPLESDFRNLTALMARGTTPLIHGPQLLDWSALPPFTMQVEDARWQECSGGACRMFGAGEEVAAFLRGRRVG